MPPLLNKGVASSFARYVNTAVKPPLSGGTLKTIVTLAIETSCDDTCVAVAELEPCSASPRLRVYFHEKITANNDAYSGIHPIVALQSHHASLGRLVQQALKTCPKPDLVAATRGPGMRSNLTVGLSTGKGLALAWNVPFIGVHHMQAHALTPRLVNAMKSDGWNNDNLEPSFPFLTVLASGGHTMLIDSSGLTEHKLLAETQDIALGDYLDKAARDILPLAALLLPYGKALEQFAFPRGSQDYDYSPPTRRQDELNRQTTKWGWSLPPPFAESKGGNKSSRRMAFSFAGLLTTAVRRMKHEADTPGAALRSTEPCLDERREMAREVQRVAFEHLASRIMLNLTTRPAQTVKAIVVSGGVASNQYLRHVLRSILDVRGYSHVRLEFPPIDLCTDNALMIAWAAMEMWNAGYQSTLDIEPIRKWTMDPGAVDGGILGVGGWTHA